ncbi:MAG: hypothetical protein CV087_23895 [Candidatus Brocadia sp. WS118]|nr:MAG: hypothetical protein CV087_23895 [Candidatus Brocadia sp. WS118]
MKWWYWLASGLLLIGIIALSFQMARFSLFPTKEEELIQFEDDIGEGVYGIFFIPGNATTQDVIQVRQQVENGAWKRIKSFPGYNSLEGYQALDNGVQLILNDTGYVKNEPDTLFVFFGGE